MRNKKLFMLGVLSFIIGLSFSMSTVKADDSGPDDAPNGFLYINNDNSTSFINNPKFTKADQDEYEWDIQHYPHTPYVIPTSFTSNRKQEYKSPNNYRILKTYKIKPQWFHSNRGAYYSANFTKINGITEDTPDVSWISTKKALVYSKATHTKRTFYYVSNNVKPNKYKLKDYFNYIYMADNLNKRNAGWIWSRHLKQGKYDLNLNNNAAHVSKMITQLFPGTVHDKSIDMFCQKNIKIANTDTNFGYLLDKKYGHHKTHHIEYEPLRCPKKYKANFKDWMLLKHNQKSLTEYIRYGIKSFPTTIPNFNAYSGYKIGAYADPANSKNYGRVLIILVR